jgi:hypothetical protein
MATPASLVTSTTIASGNLDEVNFFVKNGDWMTQLRTKVRPTYLSSRTAWRPAEHSAGTATPDPAWSSSSPAS